MEMLNLCGSKASNLIKLALNDIAVPKTWVISNNYPLSVLSKNGINLENCLKVEEFFINSFDKDEYKKLFNEVENLLKNNSSIKSFAVRSSHQYEDGENSSFSGLFYTELNLKNTGDIVNAILKCWSESFNVGVLEYSKKNDEFKVMPCNVIIQQFILSDKSGVIFSSNDNIIIDSNFGLAKSIVDGNTGCDEWIISREDNKVIKYSNSKENTNIPILTRVNPLNNTKINYKMLCDLKVLDFNNTDSTILVELSNELKKQKSLSATEISELIEKCEQVANILNIPNYDIEWTFSDGKLYILQCRPITKLIHISKEFIKEEYGIGLVSGEVATKAIKVNNQNEAIEFEEGAILVCKRLSGSSILAASKASGCIIESRSPLSHSAIIARELGIPAIGNVNIEEILDGEMYYINGTTGEYRLTNKIMPKEENKIFEDTPVINKNVKKILEKNLSSFKQDIID